MEEPRAWDGWWNESVVELVRLSMQQNDVLSVLLTGRSETGFSDLLRRMVKSKGLHFDMIVLKPVVGPNGERFSTTMQFKQRFLTVILETYKHATEISVYEDRVKHVKQFDEFLRSYSLRLSAPRSALKSSVVHVQQLTGSLDPVVEISEVQKLINNNNDHMSKPLPDRPRGIHVRLSLQKTVFFTGYMISPADSQKLLSLVHIPNPSDPDLRVYASSILICPRPCPKSVLEKVGGLGAKMTWEVVGTSCYEGSLWAASLRPVPLHAPHHTENPTPSVILALRKGARPFDAGKIQNWQPLPPEKRFQFETVVNEKVVLRIETDSVGDSDTPAVPTGPRRDGKRKQPADDELNHHHHHPPPPTGPAKNDRGGPTGRSGRGGFRGGGGGTQANRGGFKNVAARGTGGRGARGRSGHHWYRSLDDVEPKGTHANAGRYGFPAAVYDDEPPQPQRLMMAGPQGQGPPTQPIAFEAQQQQQQQQQFSGNGSGGWQGSPPAGSQQRGAINAGSVGSYY